MTYNPTYTITTSIANGLMRIESVKQAIVDLPITPQVLKTLRETARLYSTHYSTMIEGNELTQKQVDQVIKESAHFKGRERDEKEVLGYYAAVEELEKRAGKKDTVTEKLIQTLHALVMSEGKKRAKPPSYRDGQNVIRDSRSGEIVYLPPEAKDVPSLMSALVDWINQSMQRVPVPIVAAIAHYQFATIHPYYDGNGRTARLLTTLVLHLGGYDLKGIYSLEEYYAKHLGEYYAALDTASSHNYYLGRETADITQWIEYFIEGAANAFEQVKIRAIEAAKQGSEDKSGVLKNIDARQRRVLTLFEEWDEIKASDIGELLGVRPRTATNICQKWVKEGFLVITNPSRKARKYMLSNQIKKAMENIKALSNKAKKASIQEISQWKRDGRE